MIWILMIAVFIACEPMNKNSFWKEIKLDFQPNIQSVKAIQNFGFMKIFIAGAKTNTPGIWDVKTDQSYFSISTNGGRSWHEKTDFNCNSFDKIFSKDDVLIIEGSKYVGNPELFLGSKPLWFKFFISENRWEELKISDERIGGLVRVINESTYMFKDNKGYKNHDYLITRDGGESWSEYSLPFDNKRDIFNDYCIQGNNLWGVRKHESLVNDKNESEYQELISININTWNITNEISLGPFRIDEQNHRISTHNIMKIVPCIETLYLLGQDQIKNVGYVWKMNIKDNEIKIQDSFELTKDQRPVDLFYHNDQLILVCIDMSTFLPTYKLLYKKLNEKSWHEEEFPYLTSPSMSFDNGVLMGIAEDNKIYYKQF